MKFFPAIVMLSCMIVTVRSDLILETTCTIDLSLGSSSDLSLSQIYWIERETAAYFTEILSYDETDPSDANVNPLEDEVALRVVVSFQNMQLDESGREALDGSASLIYRSSSSLPIQLDKVLSNVMVQDDLADRLGSFGPGASVFFTPIDNDSKVLDVNYNAEKAAADGGLIVATAILSFVLALVSSVLLYVTGGCTACQQRVSHCLFEEIDEDDDVIYNKSSFQIQATDEESSVGTSVPNNPSGMGSSTFEQPNPAEGLGIKTTGRVDMGSYFDEDSAMDVNATPVSKVNPQPLGITSMRKMPKQQESSEEQGGLANMIMQRLYSSK